MKKIIVLLTFITPFVSANASELLDYENYYKDMNRLQGQLDKLELEKKIQQVELEILQNQQSFREVNALSVQAQNQAEGIVSTTVERFDPTKAKLQYLVGTGKDRKAIVEYNGVMRTFNQGDVFDGWKVKIEDKSVTITKDTQTIKL